MWIHLPRVAEPGNGAKEVPGEAASGPVEGTILLAEDEPAVRMMVREALVRGGFRVLEAEDGEEALAVSRGHDGMVDLLLTDVVMPQMSGKQLADRLLLLRPLLRVLFMSGYTDREMVGQLSARAAFLQKPLRPSTLTRKVREVLDTPSTQRAT